MAGEGVLPLAATHCRLQPRQPAPLFVPTSLSTSLSTPARLSSRLSSHLSSHLSSLHISSPLAQSVSCDGPNGCNPPGDPEVVGCLVVRL